MPRNPKANQDLRDERRGELMRAAALVFAKRGFARTKISEIAKVAGVSHGLVYNYFASKEAVFDEILAELMQARRAPFERPLVADGSQTVLQRIRALTEEQLVLLAEPELHTHQLVVQAMMQGGVPDYIVRKLDRHIESTHRLFHGWLVRGQAEGSIDATQPPEILASAFFALLRGLWIRPLTHTALPFATTNSEVIMRLLAGPQKQISKSKSKEAVGAHRKNAGANAARSKIRKAKS